MTELEGNLLQAGMARGKRNTFVQLPTAAGQENEKSLKRWRELGAEQGERLGAEVIYLPVYNREDAFRQELVDLIADAGLIYFSGGDPHHLALTMKETPVWAAIESTWRSGSSLGGCSAGAMAFGEQIISIRKSRAMPGLNILPQIQVIPHYDRFLGWIPDQIASHILQANEGMYLFGIDDETALIRSGSKSPWRVWGKKKVHILKGAPVNSFEMNEEIVI